MYIICGVIVENRDIYYYYYLTNKFETLKIKSKNSRDFSYN